MGLTRQRTRFSSNLCHWRLGPSGHSHPFWPASRLTSFLRFPSFSWSWKRFQLTRLHCELKKSSPQAVLGMVLCQCLGDPGSWQVVIALYLKARCLPCGTNGWSAVRHPHDRQYSPQLCSMVLQRVLSFTLAGVKRAGKCRAHFIE